MGVVRQTKETNRSRHAASRHPNTLPQHCAVSGSGHPHDGWLLAWAAAHSGRSGCGMEWYEHTTCRKFPQNGNDLSRAAFPWFGVVSGYAPDTRVWTGVWQVVHSQTRE